MAIPESESEILTQGKEELLSEPNTEQVIFRTSKGMKREVLLLAKYGNYTSYGEYFRARHREYADRILGTQGFKMWLRIKEEDENFKVEQLRQRAKDMGYEIWKIDQKVLA